MKCSPLIICNATMYGGDNSGTNHNSAYKLVAVGRRVMLSQLRTSRGVGTYMDSDYMYLVLGIS